MLPIPLIDGARAMRFVRAHAADFRVDKNRICMMGF
jgi:acetyl esterase/lipase